MQTMLRYLLARPPVLKVLLQFKIIKMMANMKEACEVEIKHCEHFLSLSLFS